MFLFTKNDAKNLQTFNFDMLMDRKINQFLNILNVLYDIVVYVEHVHDD